jgi:hypothetical protein
MKMLQSSVQSKLVAAMRRRWKTPKNVMKALGLDASMLDDFQLKPGNGGNGREGGDDDEAEAVKALSGAIQEKLREAHLEGGQVSPKLRETLIGLCEEHTKKNPTFNQPSAPAADHEKRDKPGIEELVKEYLEEQGADADEIDDVLDRLRRGGKDDAEEVVRKTPLPAKGGYGGAAAAMDSAAFARRHPEIADIAVVESVSRRPRRAAVADGFAQRHPEAARCF